MSAFFFSACEEVELTEAPENLRDGATLGSRFQAAVPVSLPAPGTFSESQSVSLSTSTTGAEIFFSLDGSTPTMESTIYQSPIIVDSSVTIKAFAKRRGLQPSKVVSFEYNITPTEEVPATRIVTSPEFSVNGGSYGQAQTVILSSGTPGATIYYTTDGETPTRSSTQYTTPITVSTTQTIKAFAVLENWVDSAPSSVTYTINGAVVNPSASVSSGTYPSARSVELSSSTADAVIHYTVDGSMPTSESSVYSGALFVGVSQTIKAIAVKANYVDSDVMTFQYTITGTVSAPEFSLASGSFGPAQIVSLSSVTPGASIYYTTDGETPTRSSTQYTTPITVSTTQTIKAFAVLDNWVDSAPSVASYTINGAVAGPTANFDSGIYVSARSVELSSVTPDAVIHYTVDGSTPTSDSSVYSETLFVGVSQTIKAIAVKANYINSDVMTFQYTITGTVSAPEFSLASGSFGPAQTVSISSGTPGATIYYTTDGETPTRSSTQYSTPITVSTTQTIKAFAVLDNWVDSAPSVTSYTINGAVAGPAANFDSGVYVSARSVELSSVTPDAVIHYTLDGSTPTSESSVYSAALFVGVSQTIKAIAVKANYVDSDVMTFQYTITGTVASPEFSLASGSFGPAQTVSLSSATPGATIYYTTDGEAPTMSSPQYSDPISVTSSQTIRAMAVKTNWADSSESSAAYTINGAVDAPAVDPAQGIYVSARSVALSSATADAVIYYTLDGSEPTNSSPAYSTPIFVGVSQTIKAIAVKANYIDSEVSTFEYTITGTVAAPEFSLASGSFGPAQTVSLSSATPGATIYYTTDGEAPTMSSPQYSDPISVASSQTIRAVAVKTNWADSSESSAAYTINGAVAPPVAIPGSGSYTSTQSVLLSTVPMDAVIYYTTDDSDPLTSGTRMSYSGAITVSSRTVIKAAAVRQDFLDSAAVSFDYEFVPGLQFSSSSFNFYAGVTITTLAPALSEVPVESCSIEPALPPGLNFDTSNCSISGTPTFGGPAVTYSITPANSSKTGNASSISISINGNDAAGAYYFNGAPANGRLTNVDPHGDKNILLMHMDGANGSTTFTDSSPSQRLSTRYGNTQISTAQSKFGGGSSFFDGAWGSDLQLSGGSDFDFGMDNFTIESWVQLSTLNGPDGHHFIACGSDNGSLCFGFINNGTQLGIARRNHNWDLLGSVSVAAGNWYHVALSRDNGTVRLFLDGNLVAEGSPGQSYSFGGNVHIGSHAGSHYFPGYIDDLRITKNIARYTTNFTPPSAALGTVCYTDGYPRSCSRADYSCPATGYCPDLAKYFIEDVEHPGLNSSGTGVSALDTKYYVNGGLAEGVATDAKTVLMLHMDGYNGSRDFVDSSAAPKSASVFGETYINTSQSKFGGGSAYFDGWGDYLSFSSPTDFTLGTGDFTTELWFYKDYNWCSWCGPSDRALLTTADPTDTDGFLMMTYYWNSIRYLAGQASGWWWHDRYPSISVNDSAWHHYAVSRQNGTTRIFLNGSKVDEFGDSTNYTNVNQTLRVGGRTLGDQWFTGYIDEVRVTKGMARYTDSFSPPSLAFNNQACYTAGVERACGYQEFACAATGYCAALSMYYVDGVAHPGLDSLGTGTSKADNKHYVNGALANGSLGQTVLLLHMDGHWGSREFVDSSPSRKNATVFGETYIHGHNKFGGGSAYFDGSGDYLSFSSPTDFALGTEDFTAELWFYQDYNWCWWCGGPSDRALLTTADPTDTDGFLMMTYYWNSIRYLAGQASGWWHDRYPSISVNDGVWYHYAVSRQNGTTRIFLNGSKVDEFGDSTNYTNVNQTLRVGGRTLGDQWFNGYIDEVRVTKGYARYVDHLATPNMAFNDNDCYTAGVARSCEREDFACPVTGYCSALAMYYMDGVAQPGLSSSGSGVSSVDNKYYINGSLAEGLVSEQHSDKTVLLMHMDGTDGASQFPDSSTLQQSVSVSGNPVISSVQSKFGGTSAYFAPDGTSNNFLEVASSSNYDWSSGDYTLEAWIYPLSYSGAMGLFGTHHSPNDCLSGVGFSASDSNFWLSRIGCDNVSSYYGSVTTNTWSHVAVVKNGGETLLFLNGNQVGSGGNWSWSSGGSPFRIGYLHPNSAGHSWEGYIDEVRVTKGLARYRSNFTPSATGSYGTCYTAGVERSCTYQEFACPGTGYCPALSAYNINGVSHPGLNPNGTGFSTSDNQYYMGGTAHPGLDSTGSGNSATNGLYYLNGATVDGYWNDDLGRIPVGFYLGGTLQVNSAHLGSSSTLAALSAEAIKTAHPNAPNGSYWIDLPESGPTLTYCLMDSVYDGGGWMLMMKATRGTTFSYYASYWTQNDTLNPGETNTKDGDAKFDVMNKFEAKDMMAIWPDLQNGGSISGSTRGWTWLQKNFNDGTPVTPISFFATDDYEMNYGGSGKFISDAKTFSGWASGIFSSQVDIRFYGFNYRTNPYWGVNARVRWGFGWNENGEGIFPGNSTWANGSNDVSGGIGMDSSYGSYSAGDYVNGAQDNTGINRSARVEIYVK